MLYFQINGNMVVFVERRNLCDVIFEGSEIL